MSRPIISQKGKFWRCSAVEQPHVSIRGAREMLVDVISIKVAAYLFVPSADNSALSVSSDMHLQRRQSTILSDQ